MREYIYYIDDDGYDTIVRDGICGVEELCRKNPVWKNAEEYYWREIWLGQGFNCLRCISLEEARAYLTEWGLAPELAQPVSSYVSDVLEKAGDKHGMCNIQAFEIQDGV